MRLDTKNWKERAEQAETQLAGCGVAARGWIQSPAVEGDWGWSLSYQDVLNLREDWERLRVVLKEGVDMVESAYVHVSHGGPTREEAAAWISKASVLLSAPIGKKKGLK